MAKELSARLLSPLEKRGWLWTDRRSVMKPPARNNAALYAALQKTSVTGAVFRSIASRHQQRPTDFGEETNSSGVKFRISSVKEAEKQDLYRKSVRYFLFKIGDSSGPAAILALRRIK